MQKALRPLIELLLILAVLLAVHSVDGKGSTAANVSPVMTAYVMQPFGEADPIIP